jgi:hypothetical protein
MLTGQMVTQSRDFLQGTLDSLVVHIAVLDAEGEIIMTSRAWARFDTARDRRFAPHDLINPMVEAIAAVGGRVAVASYDEQMARVLYMRWLSPQRERIALEALTQDGRRFLKAAATCPSVPCLECK